MKRLATILTGCLLLLSSSRAADIAATEMNALIRSIHADLLKLKKTTPWLSEYDENALSESDGHLLISYTPTEKPSTGPQPQQSDHLSLCDIAIDRSSGSKYSNAFEDERVCRFPTLGRKIYGEVLIWNGRPLEKRLKEVVISQCAKRQKHVKAIR